MTRLLGHTVYTRKGVQLNKIYVQYSEATAIIILVQ